MFAFLCVLSSDTSASPPMCGRGGLPVPRGLHKASSQSCWPSAFPGLYRALTPPLLETLEEGALHGGLQWIEQTDRWPKKMTGRGHAESSGCLTSAHFSDQCPVGGPLPRIPKPGSPASLGTGPLSQPQSSEY